MLARRWRAPPGSRAGLESNSTAVRRSCFRQDRLLIAPEREPGQPGDAMPGLPDRPDLDQLRRQARELLRAAVGRDPAAVARIRAVSERMTLSAAQLALAREYGCRTWAALRAEVQRRRSPLDRWSFGGAAAIETPSGLLLPEGLIVGADDAVLSTTLTPWENDAWPRPRGPGGTATPASMRRFGHWKRQPRPATSPSSMTGERRTPCGSGQRPAHAGRPLNPSGSGSTRPQGGGSSGWNCAARTGRRPACCPRRARPCGSARSPR